MRKLKRKHQISFINCQETQMKIDLVEVDQLWDSSIFISEGGGFLWEVGVFFVFGIPRYLGFLRLLKIGTSLWSQVTGMIYMSG